MHLNETTIHNIVTYLLNQIDDPTVFIDRKRQFSAEVLNQVFTLIATSTPEEKTAFINAINELNTLEDIPEAFVNLYNQLIESQLIIGSRIEGYQYIPNPDYKPSQEELEARNTLTTLIYLGTFSEVTFEQLINQCQQWKSVFKLIDPFNKDPHFLEDLDFITSINDPSQMSVEQIETLQKLLGYFTHLQAGMTYTPYFGFSTRLIQERITIEDELKNLDSNVLQQKYTSLHSEYGIAKVQHILGDGNCYYRSIIRSHIEQGILLESNKRSDLFNELFDLLNHIQNQDFTQRYLSEEQKTSFQLLETYLLEAERRHRWDNLQDFWHDLTVNNGELDRALVTACRFMVANFLYYFKNQTPKIQNIELTYEDLIMPSYEEHSTFEEYLVAKVLQDGYDAEGVLVQLGILPALIGCRANGFLIDRRADVIITQQNNDDMLQILKMRPYTSINIILRPGHYDALLTEHDLILREEANQVLQIPEFNFGQAIERPVNFFDIMDSSPSQKKQSIDLSSTQIEPKKIPSSGVNIKERITELEKQRALDVKKQKQSLEQLKQPSELDHIAESKPPVKETRSTEQKVEVQTPVTVEMKSRGESKKQVQLEAQRIAEVNQQLQPEASPIAEVSRQSQPEDHPHAEQHTPEFERDNRQFIHTQNKNLVLQLQTVLLEMKSVGNHPKAIAGLLNELIDHSTTFLSDGNLEQYKKNCQNLIDSNKGILKEPAPKTFLQHISEVFRKLFYAMDWLLSKVTGRATMDETYNPMARVFNRNHFLTRPEISPVSKAIQDFEQSLQAIKEDQSYTASKNMNR